MNWSDLEPETAAKHLKNTASQIRNILNLPKGTLVLVEEEKKSEILEQNWKYARIAGSPVGSMIPVFTTPEENFIMTFESSRILPIHSKIVKKYFATDDSFSLENCVQGTDDSIYLAVMTYCNKVRKEYTQRNLLDRKI